MSERYIGEIIRERRIELGVSAKEVAEYAGLHRSAYSRIERNPAANPTMHTLGPILGRLKLRLGACLLACESEQHVHAKSPARSATSQEPK